MENTTTTTADAHYAQIFRGIEYHAGNSADDLIELIHELHRVGITEIADILTILFSGEIDNPYIYYLIGNNEIDELRAYAKR
jgi:hypothetical protein